MNFNSILVGSADPAALVTYYTKLFGTPGFEDGGYAGWQIGSGYLTIGPHSEVSGTNDMPGRLIWNIESTDVAGDFARLKAAGAIVVREPYGFEGAPGSSIATLADPDGNYFQLASPMSPETGELERPARPGNRRLFVDRANHIGPLGVDRPGPSAIVGSGHGRSCMRRPRSDTED